MSESLVYRLFAPMRTHSIRSLFSLLFVTSPAFAQTVEVTIEENPAPRLEPDAPPSTAASASQETEVNETEVTANEVEKTEAPPSNHDSASNDEVIVSGTRAAQLAGAVAVISEKQLLRRRLDDPHSTLKQVPGVVVREEDGIGLRPNIAMRGVNPDRSKKITLMEDGILLGPAPYSAPAAYYFPLLSRMTQVRVIKGPGAVAFGPQTVAGAIDLITRNAPSSAEGQFELGLGQYGYRKVHAFAGTSTEQLSVLVEGVHLGNNGFKHLPDDANTGSARNEWMVKTSYLIDPHAMASNELSLKLTYSSEASNETYLGLSDADFASDPDRRYPASALDRMDNQRFGVALSHEFRDHESGASIKTTLYRHDFYRVWKKFNRLGGSAAGPVLDDPDDPRNSAYYGVLSGTTNTSGELDTLYIGPNERRFVSQGLQTKYQLKANSGPLAHRFESGLRLHYDSIERNHSERAYAMYEQELYPTDSAPLVTADNYARSYALAAHVTDAITYRRLTVTPGVRMEGIHSLMSDYLTDEESERSVLAIMPSIGAYFALLPEWGLLAGAYRGFSPPPPGSEEVVASESSVNYEAGTRYVRGQSRLELIGFLNDYRNLTDICTFSSGCGADVLDQQFDSGQALIYGLEASGAYSPRWGSVAFPLSINYTLSRGRFGNDFNSADPVYGAVERGDAIPYLPLHQLNAQIALEHERFDAYVQASYVSKMREIAGDEPVDEIMHTDGLLTFDIGARFFATRWAELYFNIRNLTDQRAVVSHRPFGARPNAPRWITVGTQLSF